MPDRILLSQYVATLLFIVAGGSQLNAAESFSKFREALTQHKRTVKVVCFGDSVTGVYYHTGGRRAYPKLVEIGFQRTEPRAKVNAVNAGISGNTTRDALARIDDDVLSHRPDLVTVMFGLNDVTRVPIKEYRDNLVKIIRRCRDAGAEVLLCTPNSVYDTTARPVKKLERYVAVVKQVGQAEQVPVADCYDAYERLRARDQFAWATLMSDEIHPNLDGHKLIAEEIVHTVLGRRVPLNSIDVSKPTAAHILSKLADEQPVHVLAMPPYDEMTKVAIRKTFPRADLKVTTWQTAGKSLQEIEQQAKKVRKLNVDLVVIAVPVETGASSREEFVKRFSWILNYSLSFGRRSWDVVGIDPELSNRNLNQAQRERAKLTRQLFRAQDLPLINREPKSESTPAEVMAERLFGTANGAGQ